MISTQRAEASTRGFTMLELLVVISIITILMAILMPVVRNIRIKAQRAATRGLMEGLSSGLKRYFQEFDDYPPHNTATSNPDDGNLYLYLCGKEGNMVIAYKGLPREKRFEPFLTFPAENLKRDGDKTIVVDTWGTPLHYFNCLDYIQGGGKSEKCHNPESFDLWSWGEDKKKDPDFEEPGQLTLSPPATAKKLDNDIANWQVHYKDPSK